MYVFAAFASLYCLVMALGAYKREQIDKALAALKERVKRETRKDGIVSLLQEYTSIQYKYLAYATPAQHSKFIEVLSLILDNLETHNVESLVETIANARRSVDDYKKFVKHLEDK